MMLIDTALKKRAAEGRPVRVGMIGAGYMGQGIALQIITATPGMELVAIANRHIKGARGVFDFCGCSDIREVSTVTSLQDAIAAGAYSITEDFSLLCEAESIDIIVEVTGDVEFSTHVIMGCISAGKDVVLMNAEVDGTIGPILAEYAQRAGIICSGCEGDQPGLEMNLYRYVTGMGLKPLVCGNIKGLQDPYRTPKTQASFAEQWKQKPHMVTSYADGTKMSFEQALVGNATGMGVAKRGMNGFPFTGHLDDMLGLYDVEELRSLGGIVDYVIGAQPPSGVYVFAECEDERQHQYLQYYKRGDGPLYSFYTPYHICHLELPISIARVALFRDNVIAPAGPPIVDVVAIAKRPLKAGETVDGLGGYMTYGECENADIAQRERLLPIGLAEHCTLTQDVEKDQALTYGDVILPEGRLCDRLRREQDERFFGQRT